MPIGDRTRHMPGISDVGFDKVYGNGVTLAGEPLDFRVLAVEFCDTMRALAPEGVHWQVGNRSISAVVSAPAWQDQKRLEDRWKQDFLGLDMLAMVERAKVSNQPAPVVPAALTDEHYAWATAALSDGWSLQLGGPWARQVPGGPHDPSTRQVVTYSRGFDADDHSVVLRKDDAVVWLVNRLVGWPDRPASRRREVYTHGWFNNGLRAFEVPDVYDKRMLAALRGMCLACEKYVGVDEIEHVGFAGAYCHDCAPAQRRMQEFPGWAD